MNLNQFTTDELATLAAWTDQLALAADLEGGYNPLNAPRLGGLAKLFCDFLLKSGAVSLPIINKTGGSLAVNKAVAVSGYDTVTNCFKVVLASNAGLPAVGVLEAALADGAQGSLRSQLVLANSGLDTSAAAVGDTVYLGTSGALTLSAPTAAGALLQKLGFVQTLVNTVAPNAGGTLVLAVNSDKVEGPTVAAREIAAISQTANTTQTGSMFRAPCAGVVVGCYIQPTGTPNQAPTDAAPVVCKISKVGGGDIASKTYNTGTTLPAVGAYDSLGTLSSTHKVLAAGDVLTFSCAATGVADMNGLLFQVDFQPTLS